MSRRSIGDGGDVAGAPQSGLGRGLSGILGDVAGHAPAREVSELLGSTTRRNSPQVRTIVAELAVDMISSAFSADGVLIARLGRDGEVDPLQTRLSTAWSPSDPLGFEINGRLWNCLTERTSVQGQVAIGPVHALFARHKVNGVIVATAVVRSRPFDSEERDQLAGLIRSAARSTEVDTAVSEQFDVRVRVLPAPAGKTSASVELFGTPARSGRAIAANADLAAATATLDAFDLDLEVRFAGSTKVNSDRATIVVLSGATGTVFGLAVTGADSPLGPVEATYSAAVSADLDPLGHPTTP